MYMYMENSNLKLGGILLFNIIYTYGIFLIHDKFMLTEISDGKSLAFKGLLSLVFGGMILWLNMTPNLNSCELPPGYFLGTYAVLGILIYAIIMLYDYVVKKNDEVFKKWDSYFLRLLVTISIIAIPGATSSLLR